MNDKIMKKYHLTSEQLESIKNEYHNTCAKDLAIRCECSISCIYNIAFKFHLKKDKEFIAEMASKNRQDPNHKGRQYLFQKGSVSHNKGLKQSDYMSITGIEKSKATRFNKGHAPKNYLPVGTERLTKDGYVEIKTEEGLRGWKLKHRVVWENINGPIPKGFNIQFRDRNRQNVVLENLYLISRADQLNTENSICRYPKELSNIIRLKGALKRQINKKNENMNNLNLGTLRNHLFDSLERVKSLNDPNTDENEKMSLEQASTICEISEQIIESYKVQVQAMGIMAKAENPRAVEEYSQNAGLLE